MLRQILKEVERAHDGSIGKAAEHAPPGFES